MQSLALHHRELIMSLELPCPHQSFALRKGICYANIGIVYKVSVSYLSVLIL